MNNIINKIIDEYLKVFPEENNRQEKLINFLKTFKDKEIIDWNNFKGHLVASGFIYAKKERKFLVLYHNDLKMFLYPGGHINIEDETPFIAAKREVKEETGLIDLEVLKIANNELIPIDIDTHVINYNDRLKLPEHYHFDFRYLFVVDKIIEINLEKDEVSNYKWITIDELKEDINYGKISKKLLKFLIEKIK